MTKSEYIHTITAELASLLTEHHSADLQALTRSIIELRARIQPPMRQLTPTELEALDRSRRDFAEGRTLTLEEAFDSIEKELSL